MIPALWDEVYGVDAKSKTRDAKASSDAWRKKVGASVREIRRLRGMTQAALAKHAGVDVATISSIERGIAIPNLALFDSIADVLEAPLDLLVGKIDVSDAQQLDLFYLEEPPVYPHMRPLDEKTDAELEEMEEARAKNFAAHPEYKSRQDIRDEVAANAKTITLPELLAPLNERFDRLEAEMHQRLKDLTNTTMVANKALSIVKQLQEQIKSDRQS